MTSDLTPSRLELELAWGPQDAGQAPAQPAAPTGDATTSAEPTQDPGAARKSPLGDMMIPMLAIFAIFYFVMIAPERKARKKRESMLQALKKGDRVLTTGGMYAIVAAVGEDAVTLQIDDGVRARFTRAAIQSVLESDAPAAKDAAAKKTG